MNTNRTIAGVAFLLPALLLAGCARSTSYVRQEDGTYRKTTRLVMQPGSPGLDFNCGEDYMVTTQFGDVTYAWPRGRGALSDDFSEIRFNGPGIRCVVKGRRLSINGKAPVEFEPGDHVRITPEGEVFVNDDARQ